MTFVAALLVASPVLAGIGPTSTTTTPGGTCTAVPCLTWAARLSSWGGYAEASKESRDGKRIFVSASTGWNLWTGAYDRRTGALLWSALDSPTHGAGEWVPDLPTGGRLMALAPDGAELYVVSEGGTTSPDTHADILTVAYNTTTGHEDWETRFVPKASPTWAELAVPTAVAVSPDGQRTFVTGGVQDDGFGLQFLTLAYDAKGTITGTPGAELWNATYDGPATFGEYDVGRDVAVSTDGRQVFVSGNVQTGAPTCPGECHPPADYLTLAYNASTGGSMWKSEYNAGPGTSIDAMAVVGSPDHKMVYVTGSGGTVAYDAATGLQRWQACCADRLNPAGLTLPSNSVRPAAAMQEIAVSADGSRVYVGGDVPPQPPSVLDAGAPSVSPLGAQGYATSYPAQSDLAVAAYDAQTGTQQWLTTWADSVGLAHGSSLFRGLRLSADGTSLFVDAVADQNNGTVAGQASAQDFVAMSFKAADGGLFWGTRFPAGHPLSSNGYQLGSVDVSPDGQDLVVTDSSQRQNSPTDVLTLHYSLDADAPNLQVPGSIVAEATNASGAAVAFQATASDSPDGSVAVSCIPSSGATFALGTSKVTCQATDAEGNQAAKSVMVTVRDTTAPTLSLPANISAKATSHQSASVTWTAAASDLVDGSVPVACNPGSGSSFQLGQTPVTCSATDARGNTAGGSFTVNVVHGDP
ncbi:MAG: HYR domain-containing protein [Thermoplasmatota archaeon]